MSEQNKTTARRFFEEIFDGRNLNVIDEIVAQDYRDHDPANTEEIHGREALKQQFAGYLEAFPDLRMTIEDALAEGDKAAVRWTARGAHQGELMGIAPTGKSVTITGISIFRFAGERIAEGWTNWDVMGMMRQLGAIPDMG